MTNWSTIGQSHFFMEDFPSSYLFCQLIYSFCIWYVCFFLWIFFKTVNWISWISVGLEFATLAKSDVCDPSLIGMMVKLSTLMKVSGLQNGNIWNLEYCKWGDSPLHFFPSFPWKYLFSFILSSGMGSEILFPFVL